MLTQIVLDDIEVSELRLALEYSVFKEIVEAIIIDKVESDTERFEFAVWVLTEAISDCLYALLSESVVAQV